MAGLRAAERRLNLRGWAFLAAALAVAEAALRGGADVRWLPAPSSVLGALGDELASGELAAEVATTLSTYAQGFGAAIAIGVPLGAAIGSSRAVRDATGPLIELLRPIPSVALIPLAITSFGLDVSMRRSIVAYVAIWPIIVSTSAGVRGGDRTLHEVAGSFGVGRAARFARVTLPAALPAIFTGIRIGSSIALLSAVTVELVTGTAGIGAYVMRQQIAVRLPEMYAGILLTGVLGYALNVVLREAERRLVFWGPEQRRRTR